MKARTMYKAFLLVFIGMFAFSFAGCGLFVEEHYSVVVEVLNYYGEPLEGAKVKTKPETEIATTDADGKVALTDLENDVEIEVIDENDLSFFHSQTATPGDDGKTITFEPYKTIGLFEGGVELDEELETGDDKGFYMLLLDPEEKTILTEIDLGLWDAGMPAYTYWISLSFGEGYIEEVLEFIPVAVIGTPEDPEYLGYYGVDDPAEVEPETISPKPLYIMEDVDIKMFEVDDFDEEDIPETSTSFILPEEIKDAGDIEVK